MKVNADPEKQKNSMNQSVGESTLLEERSIYIEGVKVLQKQERISYFVSLIISLVLVILLFIVLMII